MSTTKVLDDKRFTKIDKHLAAVIMAFNLIENYEKKNTFDSRILEPY